MLSVVAFTGASQFTFVSVIGAGGSPVAALAPALLLAARNTLYGISLQVGADRGRSLRRSLLAQGVIDETSAMAHAQSASAAKRRAFDLTAVLLFVGLEPPARSSVRSPDRDSAAPRDLGLDAIFPAVFLALLAPQLRSADSRRAALAGGVGCARAGRVRARRPADHRGRRRRRALPGGAHRRGQRGADG